MSARTLAVKAMSLPLAERVALAQALWASIDTGLHDADEPSAVSEACRRDEEMDSGQARGIGHAEAMKSARKAIGCE